METTWYRPGKSLPRPKLRSALLLLTLILFKTSYGQQLIENTNTPLAKNAGRILKLQEIWRINDDGGNYYFRFPKDLGVSADGSVFIADEDELLKFSSEGKYLKNLIKIGQGPGEVSSSFRFVISDEQIIIYDFMAAKVVRLNLNGEILSQTRIQTQRYSDFAGIVKGNFVFLKDMFPSPEDRKLGFQNMPVIIKLVTNDGKLEKDAGSIHKEIVVGKGITSWTGYRLALDGLNGLAYVSDTREYLISVLDVLSGQMKRLIKRKYASIAYKERGWEANFYKTNQVPKIQNEIDIVSLFLKGKSLWVKTSTSSKEKGDLIDAFNDQGRFSDSFYLGPGRTLFGIKGEEIYITEKSADDIIVLVKYKIVG
jgi:hypothetical protein